VSVRGVEHLDAVLLEVAEEVLRLLARELDVLERGGERRRGQEPTLLTFADHPLQLLDLDHGCVRGHQQPLKHLAQPGTPNDQSTPRRKRAGAPTSPDLR
jgi:hypothetical protein